MQCQSMFTYGHNAAISMDATFGTNDAKYHLFTLMSFAIHHTRVPLTWITTSSQIVDDLIQTKQKCCQSCLIGDQVASLLMMPLKSCGHYNEYQSYLFLHNYVQ